MVYVRRPGSVCGGTRTTEISTAMAISAWPFPRLDQPQRTLSPLSARCRLSWRSSDHAQRRASSWLASVICSALRHLNWLEAAGLEPASAWREATLPFPTHLHIHTRSPLHGPNGHPGGRTGTESSASTAAILSITLNLPGSSRLAASSRSLNASASSRAAIARSSSGVSTSCRPCLSASSRTSMLTATNCGDFNHL